MDVDDVTEYAALVDQQKKALQDARKRRGNGIRDCNHKEYVNLMFKTALMSCENNEAFNRIHSSVLLPAYLPCITPMTQLRPVEIKDLQLETHHRGTYLLLRSITPPHRKKAIMALTEDKSGDEVLLQLYQQENEDIRAAENIVPVGTILLIKEPYFKLVGESECGVRVDHLSDVIHLKKDDDRIPKAWQPKCVQDEISAESLKIRGNYCMKEGKYWNAIYE